MATWVAHMRVAAHFMRLHPGLDNREFLVGNIAPDCGALNPDKCTYTPDKAVTHFYAPGGARIEAERFAEEYLRERDERYPFYLGYYFHLLTDRAFSEWYSRKKQEPLYAEGLARDPQFIWDIKRDWYGQDRLYLQANPGFIFFTMFAKTQSFPNVYFDVYPPEAFAVKVRDITRFYLEGREDPDRAFPYLAKEEMDWLVEDAIQTIKQHTENYL